MLTSSIAAASGMVAAGSPILRWPGIDSEQEDNHDCPRIVRTDRGPYYPESKIPSDVDLTTEPLKKGKADGQVLYLFGKILAPDCAPIKNARVEIWQADSNGLYKHSEGHDGEKLDPHFGYFGQVLTNEKGLYLFKTIVPASYTAGDLTRAPHIHIGIKSSDYGAATTEVYFAGKEDDRIREQDRVFGSRRNPERLIVPKKDPGEFSLEGVTFDDHSLCCNYDMAYARNRKRQKGK